MAAVAPYLCPACPRTFAVKVKACPKCGGKVERLSCKGGKSKYNAQRTEVDGHVFPSKRESERYLVLKALQAGGAISELKLQQPFRLDVYGVHVGKFTADFTYLENGERVVEDSKGYRVRDYRLRRMLMLACHGIRIRET